MIKEDMNKLRIEILLLRERRQEVDLQLEFKEAELTILAQEIQDAI